MQIFTDKNNNMLKAGKCKLGSKQTNKKSPRNNMIKYKIAPILLFLKETKVLSDIICKKTYNTRDGLDPGNGIIS